MRKSKNENRYDENAKKLLSQKIVLAHILVNCVKEYKGMNPKSVVKYIEGDPEVSTVKVDDDGNVIEDFIETSSDVIRGLNTEDASRKEGTIYYDIKFEAFAPQTGKRVKFIVDVESQYKFHPSYDLTERGIYYGARMISSQKNVEFVNSEYNDIKKVYSIWICIDCPKEYQNTITEFSIQPNSIVGKYNGNLRYDLMSVILVCLPDEIMEESDELKLHKLLYTFFSSDMNEREKKDILENEYEIEYSKDIERSVREMCNASLAVMERAEKKGMLKGMLEGRRKGMLEGRREGMLEGRREGMLEGRREGMLEGRREGMLEGKIIIYHEFGLSVDEIAEKLHVSIDKIKEVIVSQNI